MNFQHLKESSVVFLKENTTKAGIASVLYALMCCVLHGFNTAALNTVPIDGVPDMPTGKTMLIAGAMAMVLKGRNVKEWLGKFLGDDKPGVKL